MSEEQSVPPTGDEQGAAGASSGVGSTGESVENSWQEVGRQFQTLGQSLADTVRTTWESEETQRRLQEMRTGLESMVREVGQAIDESANSPQGQKIRQDADRAADAVRSATEQTVQEVRPQLITALQQLNNELQKLVNRMKEPPDSSSGHGENI